MDISNAKAAQMRWFRFKQQMEGIPRNKPISTDARVTKPKPKAKAKGKAKPKGKKVVKEEEEEEESSADEEMKGGEEENIKDEEG